MLLDLDSVNMHVPKMDNAETTRGFGLKRSVSCDLSGLIFYNLHLLCCIPVMVDQIQQIE